jgi:hypothetical protein
MAEKELADKKISELPLDTYNDIPVHILKEWAIACVKQIMEDSINEYATEHDKEDHMDWYTEMPNGKICHCDPEMQCEYHYTGVWLMDKFDIKPEELGGGGANG